MENYPSFRKAMFHLEVDSYALLTRLPVDSYESPLTCMPKARRQHSSWARIKLSKKFYKQMQNFEIDEVKIYFVWFLTNKLDWKSYHFSIVEKCLDSHSTKSAVLMYVLLQFLKC